MLDWDIAFEVQRDAQDVGPSVHDGVVLELSKQEVEPPREQSNSYLSGLTACLQMLLPLAV